MDALAKLYKLYIFEMRPKEQRAPGTVGWWRSVQPGKQVPNAFARSFLLTSDLIILSVAVLIGIITHAAGITIVNLELLFVGACALLLVARNFKRPLPVVGAYLTVIGLGVILNLALLLAFNLALAAALCWFGWTRRTQYLLVVRLHETQEQLREQMVRSEELAAERERTRIARDIHDVLRESITESRRVVGLLREKPPATAGQDDLSANLRLITTTFNERTGIHCRFEESGTPHKVSPHQRETLQLALREMLTNAHRHGASEPQHWVVRSKQERLQRVDSQ